MRKSYFLFSMLVILEANVVLQAQVNIPLDRKVGEIFVAIGGGHYQVWHPTPPTATLVETITNGAATDNNAGCAFSSTYAPFTTDLSANNVFKDFIDDPQNVFQTISVVPAGGAQPTSVAFDSLGHSYVGVAAGNGLIEEYGPSGTLVQTLPLNTSKLKDGSPWMDLSTDAQTIYFTNGSNTVHQYVFSTNMVSKFATISGATLYALRVLPTATQTATGGLLLVAAVFSGSSNIQLLDSSGATKQTYSVTAPPVNEANFQVLTLDPNGTSFWAGNPTTHNFYRFNLATGRIEVGPVNTAVGSGPNGMCAYGGFSAAQPQPITVTASLVPNAITTNTTCSAESLSGFMNCTFSTVVPPPATAEACPDTVNTITSNCFVIALNGINVGSLPLVAGTPTLQLVYNYSQIAQAAGTSYTGLPCALTSPDGSKCEVHSIDATPNNLANGDTSIYQGFDVAMDSVRDTLNPVALKNEFTDINAAVIHDQTLDDGSDTTTSIFTMNEQPIAVSGSQSCGYTSPLLNAEFNQGRTIPFKFTAVSPPNTCPSGPNFLTNLKARLELVQLNNLSNPNAPPHRVDFSLSDGTPCTESTPCFYGLSTNTWILNVSTKGLQGAVNGIPTQYLGTTIDDSHQIPTFSTTASGPTDIFFLD